MLKRCWVEVSWKQNNIDIQEQLNILKNYKKSFNLKQRKQIKNNENKRNNFKKLKTKVETIIKLYKLLKTI